MDPYGSVWGDIKTGRSPMAHDHFQTPPDLQQTGGSLKKRFGGSGSNRLIRRTTMQQASRENPQKKLKSSSFLYPSWQAQVSSYQSGTTVFNIHSGQQIRIGQTGSEVRFESASWPKWPTKENRHLFFVMGYFWGPLGKLFSRVMGFFLGPLGIFFSGVMG